MQLINVSSGDRFWNHLLSIIDRILEWRIHDLWREFAEAEIRAGKFKDRRSLYEGEECRERVDLREYPRLEVVKLDDMVGVVALDVWGLKHLKSLRVTRRGNIGNEVALKVRGRMGILESLTCLRCGSVASSEWAAELGLLTNLQYVELTSFRGDRLPT